MNKQDVFNIAYEQFAKDFNCDPDCFVKGGVYFSSCADIPGRRRYQPTVEGFRLITTGKTMVIMCEDRYRDFAEKSFKDKSPEWIFEFPNLSLIESELQKNGECIADAHQFYLPFPGSAEPKNSGIVTKFYRGSEIDQFKGDKRFSEAYAFNSDFPDELGVSASIGGEIIAMAGASRDSEIMYQIGIDVIGASRGSGVASYLTWILKEKLISEGLVPFYGTAVSHFASQNVARRSGFFPAWAEIYSKKK